MDIPLRERLRGALRDAMKARDATAVAALRATLAAIDNAEAVPVGVAPLADGGVIAAAVNGLGAGEVARQYLSEQDVQAIVRDEVAERTAAAAEYERLGQADRARELRAEVAVLVGHLE